MSVKLRVTGRLSKDRRSLVIQVKSFGTSDLPSTLVGATTQQLQTRLFAALRGMMFHARRLTLAETDFSLSYEAPERTRRSSLLASLPSTALPAPTSSKE